MTKNISHKKGFVFKTYEAPYQSPFENLFDVFKELITHTSGDFDEAIDWLRELDKEYKLTTSEYTVDDFIEDLKKKGYIREEIDSDGNGAMAITAKTERAIRQQALDQIFGSIKRSGQGNHKSKSPGIGDEHTGDFRNYQFGDALDKVSITESIRNAQINNGIDDFHLTWRFPSTGGVQKLVHHLGTLYALTDGLVTTRLSDNPIDRMSKTFKYIAEKEIWVQEDGVVTREIINNDTKGMIRPLLAITHNNILVVSGQYESIIV